MNRQENGAGSNQEFVISRLFHVPRERMFELWTTRDHLMRWFSPKGVKMFACTNDLRPGGIMHYGLRTADGIEYWGRWLYREIAPPVRLVFVLSFSDPQAGVTRNPWNARWPQQTLSTITFDDEDGSTRVTVSSVPYEATEEERAAFEAGFNSMHIGWGGTLDQLEDYVEMR